MVTKKRKGIKFPQPTKEKIKEYKEHIETQGKTENTVKQYINHLKNIPKNVEAYFSNKNLRAKKTKVAAYRSYLRFLTYITEDLTHKEYLIGLDRFKPPKKKIGYVSPRKWAAPKKEWNNYINKAPNPVGKFGMWMGFNFGLRRAEITHLRVQDIDFKRNCIKICIQKETKTQEYWQPKYEKSREISFTEKQARYFKRWIDEIRPKDLEHDYLLWTYRNHRPLQVKTFYLYCKKTGVTPHILRYSFGTHWYEVTKDIKWVSGVMGHEDVSTTSDYLLLGQKETEEKTKDYFNKFNKYK